MKITQLNKLCKSDKDVLELGARIGKVMFAAKEAAESGKPFELPTASDELELDQAVYATGYAYGKRKAKARDAKPGTTKPIDLFGHF